MEDTWQGLSDALIVLAFQYRGRLLGTDKPLKDIMADFGQRWHMYGLNEQFVNQGKSDCSWEALGSLIYANWYRLFRERSYTAEEIEMYRDWFLQAFTQISRFALQKLSQTLSITDMIILDDEIEKPALKPRRKKEETRRISSLRLLSNNFSLDMVYHPNMVVRQEVTIDKTGSIRVERFGPMAMIPEEKKQKKIEMQPINITTVSVPTTTVEEIYDVLQACKYIVEYQLSVVFVPPIRLDELQMFVKYEGVRKTEEVDTLPYLPSVVTRGVSQFLREVCQCHDLFALDMGDDELAQIRVRYQHWADELEMVIEEVTFYPLTGIATYRQYDEKNVYIHTVVHDDKVRDLVNTSLEMFEVSYHTQDYNYVNEDIPYEFHGIDSEILVSVYTVLGAKGHFRDMKDKVNTPVSLPALCQLAKKVFQVRRGHFFFCRSDICSSQGSFTYCLVELSISSNPYWYLAGENQSIEEGDEVRVPVGYQNTLHYGYVVDIVHGTKADAPYPFQELKSIYSVVD